MRKKLILLTVLLITISSGPNAKKQAAASSQALVLQPCDVRGIQGKAQCGNLQVFENRDARKGRKISLKIVVLPATGTERSPDPLFYIPGGPGSSATEDAPGVATLFTRIRERHDLVFLDQRGTGGSNPLNCEFFNVSDPPEFSRLFLSPRRREKVSQATRNNIRSHALHDSDRDG